MKVGVYGSAKAVDKRVAEKARTIGEILAEKGHSIITGGCNGYSYEAVLAASKAKGVCIGFSPFRNLQEHRAAGFPANGFAEIIFLPADFPYAENPAICMKYRNVMSVAACDCCIFIGGRLGTMNEFTNAADMKKDIGVLEGSGGITEGLLQQLVKVCAEKIASKILFEKDTISMVQKLVG